MPISKFDALLVNEQGTEKCVNAIIEQCTDNDIKQKLVDRVADTKYYWNAQVIYNDYIPTATPGKDVNYEGTEEMKEGSVESSMS